MLKLLRYLKKYWWAAILAPIFMVIEVSMDMMLTGQMQQMIDFGIPSKDLDKILSIGFTMIVIVFIGVVGGFLSGVFANIASCNFANDLRQDLFKKIKTGSNVSDASFNLSLFKASLSASYLLASIG